MVDRLWRRRIRIRQLELRLAPEGKAGQRLGRRLPLLIVLNRSRCIIDE